MPEQTTVTEQDVLDVIDERDRAQEWADKLAAAIAPAEVIGEHSNGNNPWRNALEHASSQGIEIQRLRDELEKAHRVVGELALKLETTDVLQAARDLKTELAALRAAIGQAFALYSQPTSEVSKLRLLKQIHDVLSAHPAGESSDAVTPSVLQASPILGATGRPAPSQGAPSRQPQPGDRVRVTLRGHVAHSVVDDDGHYIGRSAVVNGRATVEVVEPAAEQGQP